MRFRKASTSGGVHDLRQLAVYADEMKKNNISDFLTGNLALTLRWLGLCVRRGRGRTG